MSYKRFVGLSAQDVDTINAVLQRQAARNLQIEQLPDEPTDDESVKARMQRRGDLYEESDMDLDMLVPILTLMLTGDRP